MLCILRRSQRRWHRRQACYDQIAAQPRSRLARFHVESCGGGPAVSPAQLLESRGVARLLSRLDHTITGRVARDGRVESSTASAWQPRGRLGAYRLLGRPAEGSAEPSHMSTNQGTHQPRRRGHDSLWRPWGVPSRPRRAADAELNGHWPCPANMPASCPFAAYSKLS